MDLERRKVMMIIFGADKNNGVLIVFSLVAIVLLIIGFLSIRYFNYLKKTKSLELIILNEEENIKKPLLLELYKIYDKSTTNDTYTVKLK